MSSPMVSLPLILMLSMMVNCEYSSTMHCRLVLEVRRVVLGPPILQITLGIEVAAFIVEAVCQFVADGLAGVAVIRSVVIHLWIEQRRLQDASGKLMSFICALL